MAIAESLRPSAFQRDPSLSPEELAEYLAEIGGTLVAYGCPAYRLEEVIRAVAALEGWAAEAFAFPTGLFVSIVARGLERPVIRMVRVKDWAVALDRLALIDEIFNDVAEDRLTIRAAIERLRKLKDEREAYPSALRVTATALASAAAAVFFRGGTKEIAVAAGVGALVGIIGWGLRKDPSARFLVELGGGFIAALAAWTITRLRPDISREVLVLSGVITLVPGMTLTTGLAEHAR
jgi:uncharacterized membrane protein YjjP (DUF1212 family)